MKLALLFFSAFIISSCALAQSFQNGTNALNIGLGVGSSLGGFGYSSQTPALSLQYDRGLWDIGSSGVISLGGYLGYKGFTYKYNYSTIDYRQSWKYIILGVRGAYHYNGFDLEKWDFYGGAMLSYNILSYSFDSNGTSYDTTSGYGSTVAFSLFLGTRYFITEKLAALAEVGYGISYLTLGVSLKF